MSARTRSFAHLIISAAVKVWSTYYDFFPFLSLFSICRAQQLRVLDVQVKIEHGMAAGSACAECARSENLRVIDQHGKEYV